MRTITLTVTVTQRNLTRLGGTARLRAIGEAGACAAIDRALDLVIRREQLAKLVARGDVEIGGPGA